MSVFPEFIQHIHDMDMYVPGYNYEEMYNIMIYNLTYNIISTNNFVYTYAFMNQLYNYLEELLLDSEPEVEPNTNNSNNLPINDVNIIDIHINENNQNQYNDAQNNQNQYNEEDNQNNQNQYNDAQDNQHQANEEDNQNALQLFNNYIITTMNNHPMNNINYTNNTNMNNDFTYTNLVYYNNL